MHDDASIDSPLRDVFDLSFDALVIADAGTGRVLAANAAARELYRLDLVGAPFPGALLGVLGDGAPLAEALAAPPGSRTEIGLDVAGGDRVHLELAAAPTTFAGRPATLVVARDVTRALVAERALRESEERYGLVAYGANDGLWDWNLITNEMFFSARWKSMLGYEEDEIGTSPNEMFLRVHPADAAIMQERIAGHFEETTPNFEVELRIMHKDGSYRWMLIRGLAVRDAAGKAYRMAGSQTDITERRNAQEQLVRKALYDSLTGLPNRALFMDRLRHAGELAKRRKGYLFAVLFIDLDRFKVVNDSLGHLVGDQLLVHIARRLETSVRPTDTFARLGGDEFAILLDDISRVDDATLVADRIKSELGRAFVLDGHTVFTTASIGIALSEEGYNGPEDLLREADLAMYRAKAVGKARYEVYEPAAHVKELVLLHLENDLRGAVDRGEFALNYQPIVALETGTLAGFEALVRWRHPDRGMVSPAEFIPVAEETGVIVELGRWVLAEACRQARRWQQTFAPPAPFAVSVNLSPKQFTQCNIVEDVRAALAGAGLEASLLKLEITESVLMGNTEAAMRSLSELKALGLQLMIDDFGTGYSSLSYLHKFPIDVLKIDRSFVSNINDVNEKNFEIVRSIVDLARNLGLAVVAEGVETSRQAKQLRELACAFGQGYYFSRPRDTQSVDELLGRCAADGWRVEPGP